MTDPHAEARRFDRAEILGRLKAVEQGGTTKYERELLAHEERLCEEVDRQLERHPCYTSEHSRQKFWHAVLVVLSASDADPHAEARRYPPNPELHYEFSQSADDADPHAEARRLIEGTSMKPYEWVRLARPVLVDLIDREEQLREAATELRDNAGVDDIDPRLSYINLQVTREAWASFVAALFTPKGTP